MPDGDGYFSDREVAEITGLEVTAKLQFAYGTERKFHRLAKDAWEEYPPDREPATIDA